MTVLHHAIQTKTGLITYYGPCVMTQFGENPRILDYTWRYFKSIVIETKQKVEIRPSDYWTNEVLNWFTKKDLKRARKLNKNEGHLWLKNGVATGNLWAGCIPSINHIIGTEYLIKTKDPIFFMDISEGPSISSGLSVSNLDSYLSDISNVGVFEKIKGLVIGRLSHYTDNEIKEIKGLIMNYTKDHSYPIVMNVNFGHADPIVTLPYVARIILNSDKDEILIKQWVSFYKKIEIRSDNPYRFLMS